jgi:hypothetical protein
MLTYLLEKLDKIKKKRDLYCSQIEKIEKTQIEKTQIEKTQKGLTAYDFFCRKN